MKRTEKTWIYGAGTWRVTDAEFERLWKQASWDVRMVNDPERARKEWREYYNGGK